MSESDRCSLTEQDIINVILKDLENEGPIMIELRKKFEPGSTFTFCVEPPRYVNLFSNLCF